MTARVPEREQCMILVNVLMFVAIASGLVLLMINREEVALDRSIRSREAARALAIVRGGEGATKVVAVRVTGAASPAEAKKAAKKAAKSAKRSGS